MTAEIVIMNRDAVAMASDSVVTIGDEFNDEKTYPSANKLFAINYDLPVGIMTYGNGLFMDISWETLIKLYRDKCAGPFLTLEEYVTDFLKFLESINLFDETHQKGWIKNNFILFHLSIRERIMREFSNTVENPDDLNKPVEDAASAIEKILKNVINLMNQSKEYYFTTQEDIQKDEVFIDSLSNELNGILQECYGKVYEEFRELINELSSLHFSRIGLSNFSGIVISGFGDDDIFPRTFSLTMKEIRSNKVIYTYEEKFGPGVFPFAQRDMVDLFMTGFSPVSLSNILDAIDNKHPKECIIIKSTIQNAIQNDIDSTVQLVQNLPKSEIAFMAETLVNLTSFKRMFSRGVETVGGPIDVAVISKGDGFIWIKRKHYFEPELNPHFIAKHYN